MHKLILHVINNFTQYICAPVTTLSIYTCFFHVYISIVTAATVLCFRLFVDEETSKVDILPIDFEQT